MKRILFLLAAIALCAPLVAQEELTTAYFPQTGDTLLINQADSAWAASLDFQLDGGANLTWDFVDPVSATVNAIAVRESNNPAYPTADVVVATDFFNTEYYRFDGDTMNLVAVTNRLTLLPSFEVSAALTPARAERRTGFSPGESFTTTATAVVVISPDSIPPEALALAGAELLANVDSIRVTTVSVRTDTVDAFGTVNLGDNTYETIRERRRETSSISIELKGSGSDWVDATAALESSPDIGSAVGAQDTTDTYIWWHDDSKEAIARVETDIRGRLLGMQYKRAAQSTSTFSATVDQARVALYPNPATDLVNFRVEGLRGGRYSLHINSLLGQRISEREFTALGNQNRLLLDVSEFHAGLYFVTLRNQQGRILTTRRLKVL